MSQTKEQRERIFGAVDQTNKTLSGLARGFDPEALTDDTALVFIALGNTVDDASKGYHSAIVIGDNNNLRDALVKTIEREPQFAEIIADALEVWTERLEAKQQESNNKGEALAAALKELFSKDGKNIGGIIIGGFGRRGGSNISEKDLSGLPPFIQELIKRQFSKGKG